MAGEGAKLATGWLELTVSTDGAQKSITDGVLPGATAAGNQAGGLFGASFGKVLAAGAIAGAVVVGFKKLYEIGSIFDDVTDTIRVGTGATGDALESLSDSARKVGTIVPTSFEAAGSVVADLNTRLGLTGGTLETVASQYLEAGRILEQDVDIQGTTAAFSAFGIEGDAVSGAMDNLFRVSQATGVGMNELSAAAQAQAPALQILGFSFEDTISLVGSLDKAGLNSTAVMASMSKGLVTLAKDGEEPQAAFQRVTGEIEALLESGDKAAAIDLAAGIFGTRGATQFIGAVESGTVAFDDLMAATGASGDTILGVAADTRDFAESWVLVKNRGLDIVAPAAEGVFALFSMGMAVVADLLLDLPGKTAPFMAVLGPLGAAFGEVFTELAPFVEALFTPVMALRGVFLDMAVDFLTNLIPALLDFSSWVSDNSTLIGAIAVILGGAIAGFYLYTGAMTVVRVATGLWAGAQALLNGIMALNPIMLVVIAIAALVAGIIWVATQTTFFHDAWAVLVDVFVNSIGMFTDFFTNTIGMFADFFTNTVGMFFDFGAGVVEFIAGFWQGMQDTFAAALAFLLDLFFTWHPLGILISHFDQIVAFFSGFVSNTAGMFTDFFTKTIGMFVDFGAGAVSLVVDFVSRLVGFYVGLAMSIGSTVSGMWSAVTGFFSGFISGAVSLVVDFVSRLVGFYVGLAVSIGSTVSGMWSAVTGYFSGFVSGAVSLVSGFASSLVSFFTSMWSGATSAVSSGIATAVGFIAGLPGKALAALGNMGSYLANAGRDLIQGFIDGISGMLGKVGDAVGGVMDFVGGFFPHSPAERGPFSGSGWRAVKNAGLAIGEEFGSGLTESEQALNAQFDSMMAMPSSAAARLSSRTYTTAGIPAAQERSLTLQYTATGDPGLSSEERLFKAGRRLAARVR